MGFKGEFRQWSIFCGLAIEILLSSGLWQSSSPSAHPHRIYDPHILVQNEQMWKIVLAHKTELSR